MKNFFLFVVIALFISQTHLAQTTDTNKKVRAGLKGSIQPCWFNSGNNNTMTSATGFGYGFGLVLDFRLSEVIYFSTGIGGDFESGSVRYRDDGYNPNGNIIAQNSFATHYMQDNAGVFVEAKNGVDFTSFAKAGNVRYSLSTRNIKTTYVTIPVLLKMLTKEYSGFRYYGQFGGDIGVRAAATADDTYSYRETYVTTGVSVASAGGSGTNQNIYSDALAFPFRVGLNVGLGAEYRVAGSTSIFATINYFHSFTNLMGEDSRYLYNGATTDATSKMTFTNLKQNLFMDCLKINIGVMF